MKAQGICFADPDAILHTQAHQEQFLNAETEISPEHLCIWQKTIFPEKKNPQTQYNKQKVNKGTTWNVLWHSVHLQVQLRVGSAPRFVKGEHALLPSSCYPWE